MPNVHASIGILHRTVAAFDFFNTNIRLNLRHLCSCGGMQGAISVYKGRPWSTKISDFQTFPCASEFPKPSPDFLSSNHMNYMYAQKKVLVRVRFSTIIFDQRLIVMLPVHTDKINTK